MRIAKIFSFITVLSVCLLLYPAISAYAQQRNTVESGTSLIRNKDEAWNKWVTVEEKEISDYLQGLYDALENHSSDDTVLNSKIDSTMVVINDFMVYSDDRNVFNEFIGKLNDIHDYQERIAINSSRVSADGEAQTIERRELIENRELDDYHMCESYYSISVYKVGFWTYFEDDDDVIAGDNWIQTKWRGYSHFDISSIPENATINEVNIWLYVYEQGDNDHDLDVYALPSNPGGGSSADVWDAIVQGSIVANNDDAYRGTGNMIIPLNYNAINIIQSKVDDGENDVYFGFREDGDNDTKGNAYGYADGDSYKPLLVVYYDVPQPDITFSVSGMPTGTVSENGDGMWISINSSPSTGHSWSVSESSNWISFSETNGYTNDNTYLTISQNSTYSQRRGNITFYCDEAEVSSQSFQITQAGEPQPDIGNVSRPIIEGSTISSIAYGSGYRVTWNSQNVSRVDIDIVRSNGTVYYSIADNLNDDGDHSWTMPSRPGAESSLRIRVSDNNSSEASYSDYFSAGPPSFSFEEPDGGEDYQTGERYDIEWVKRRGDENEVDLYLSRNGGNSWSEIQEEVGQGSAHSTNCDFSWYVNAEPTDNARIKIVSTYNSSYYEISNQFSIVPPPPELVWEPNALSFSTPLEMGQSETRTITLQNTGGSAAYISDVTSSSDDFTLINPRIQYDLQQGQSQAYTIQFSPSMSGNRYGTLRAHSPSGDETASMSGIGLEGPNFAWQPTFHDFGSIPVGEASESFTVQLKNIGETAGEVSHLAVSGPFSIS
ncbi:choice-of-anchor D domain-containing protein, partial [bacterium]|nr:choice-of-anchor D domain-containing protein [bacterium]